ncbi:Cytochrome b5 [Macrophomina phaseolina MS6]|uniref:Cytochrome b5 n=1 Tax=Macrophomina phaseolina (strain MS6) TaxID=1126212 RepID=K2RH93_MACPH|nr:Cytochrome b5 [Macrophomina phaseolina MS6]
MDAAADDQYDQHAKRYQSHTRSLQFFKMAAKKLQLDKIAAPDDLSEVIPIVFSWNYIPRLPPFIVAQDWSFELPIDADRDATDPFFRNSFPIYPKAAGLPYHTGLTCLRHNRFWRPALKYAAELCELLAADQSYNNANLTRGGTLASIGQRELKKPEGERFVTFAINLFPQADEERMKLIAVGILFVVTFDGTDGGAHFISSMLDWVLHQQPTTTFTTPREYLDYRWDDAANAWLIASCKFSIASPIALDDPLLARLRRLAGDHVSIVNDLGSFDKERAAFEAGRTVVLINLVQVMRDSCGLGVDDAKAAAYALQLLNEAEILQELERLKRDGRLTVEHWRFVETLLLLIAGNTFYTMTTSRYGGEAARI